MTSNALPRFVTIHMVQNHVPANLNRDDLSAPKVAYFGGVLRARISSQCLKRTIRRSEIFAPLCGGLRTRRLAELLSDGDSKLEKKVHEACNKLGLKTKNNSESSGQSKLAIYLSTDSIRRLRNLMKNEASEEFGSALEAELCKCPRVPDVALFGRMLEATELSDTKVEAACQVAHALSTHECLPEVDYFTAVDDVPGDDAGAAYLDEAGYVSACFYKFFSIDRRQLVENLTGDSGGDPGDFPEPEKLAANTIVTFLEAAAYTIPSGKRNAFAPFDPPVAVIVELRDFPLNYANAFAKPVSRDSENLVATSVACLFKFAEGCDQSFRAPTKRYVWMLEGLPTQDIPKLSHSETVPVKTFQDLLQNLAKDFGYSLEDVRGAVLPKEYRLDALLREHRANKQANKTTSQG